MVQLKETDLFNESETMYRVLFFKRFFIFLIVILFFPIAFPAFTGENGIQDSLGRVLKEEFLPQTKNQFSLGLMIQTSRQMRVSEPERAIAYSMEIYKLALKFNEPLYAANALYEIGKIYSDKLMYFTSLEYSMKGYQLLMQAKEYKRGGYFLIGIGNCYFHLGSYPMAYNRYKKAFEIFEETENFHGQAVAYNNIGLIKEELKDYDSALYYFSKALSYREKTYLKANIGHSYYYIGKNALDRGDLEKARQYFDKAIPLLKTPTLDFSLKRDFYTTLGLLHFDYGRLYDLQKNHDAAIGQYKKSVHVLDSIRDIVTMAKVYLEMGNSYTRFGRSNSAMENFRKALFLSDSLNDMSTQRECYKKMIENYKMRNLPDSLYTCYHLFAIISDSMQHQMIQSKFNEIEQALKITEFENEATILRQKNLNFKIITYAGIIAVFFIFTVILLYVFKLRQHRRANTREIASRKEAEKEQERLLKELQDINVSKDRFISIMAHDLRSPFNALMGFSDLLVEEIKENDKPELKKYALVVQQIARNSFQLLENLLTWSRLQLNRINLQPMKIRIYDEINLIINIYVASASKKSIYIQNLSSKEATVYADPNMTQTVLQNLVSNAIKFTRPGGFIKISTEVKDKLTIIRVQDNGIGISPEVSGRLFNDDEFVTTKGTEDERGTGLGLLLCKQMIEKNGGSIWIDSTSDQGTTVAFSLFSSPPEASG